MQTFLVVIEKTFLMRIYSSHLNILSFFSRFYFFGHKYKGHDFLQAVGFAPVASPSATRLNTNNIFNPPSTPVNLEEDQPEQDFN